MSNTAYIALGANLGEPLEMLRWAKQEVGKLGRVSGQSHLYRTRPVGGPVGQPDYLNGILRLDTNLAPEPLLEALHEIEKHAGRERKIRWEARVLDLDLILCGNLVRQGQLEVPHPRAWERGFVLAPLADLAPSLRHPVSSETVLDALKRVGDAGLIRLEDDW